jgi:predicted AAA+ superfamily ATPase
MQYKRAFNITALLPYKSLFIFGPRQTGKTTFLREHYPDARYINLLDAQVFRAFNLRPEIMRQSLLASEKLVIIDEIQRLPELLNEVQLLIDRNKELRFILTGSSARKLKRGAANLLGGRALMTRMHPFVSVEIGYERLEERVVKGSLPSVIDSPIWLEELGAYTEVYLKEEIQAEGLTRNLENFSRFLRTAALSNAQQLNYTSLGADAGVPPRTAQHYYQVLEDTLLGYQLPPYSQTKKLKAVATSKFYFFDVGVANALVGRSECVRGTETYGNNIEHLIFLELRASLDYHRKQDELCYWRTTTQFEVDFVVGEKVAIEVRASERVTDKNLKGLRAFAEELSGIRKIVVSHEPWLRVTDDGIEIMPIEYFLTELWAGEVV